MFQHQLVPKNYRQPTIDVLCGNLILVVVNHSNEQYRVGLDVNVLFHWNKYMDERICIGVRHVLFRFSSSIFSGWGIDASKLK